MKIVINAVSAKMGGAVNYLTHLLRELSAREDGDEYLVLLPAETAAKLKDLAPHTRLRTTQIGHAGLRQRLWWEQVTLRRLLHEERADALFSTANFAMFRCPVRQILLVRNALFFSQIYREKFLPRHARRFRMDFELRRRLICWSAKSADVMMTPSQAMLDDLRRFVRVKRAVVNPYGVSATGRPEQEERDLDAAGKLGVRLLYVSLYSEHKNLSTLLKAMAHLSAKGSAGFRLTTTVNPGWAGAGWTLTHEEDLRLARQPGIAEYVEFVGPLSHQDTDRLYRTSDIIVFPSLTESFGFPMAEAMSHGLPIVAADTPVNREVCGEAAVYFSPFSPESLAERLEDLAADVSLQKRLGDEGRRQASRRFSWNAHARRIAEALCSLKPEAVRDREPMPLAQ